MTHNYVSMIDCYHSVDTYFESFNFLWIE